ncbi:unnamed protein product, partial [Parnassius mnemosyne]|uniref:Transposable element P transposase n=1 Tax=Parnassius mnemosyne TaxID=213953 RepID=A0AAV1LEK0_9NEOP
MRVNLAAQVFSHSVSAGLYSKISDGVLTTEALATAELVSKMDKLFDLLNSSTSNLKNGKPHATNISKTSPHWEFFNEMRGFFKSLILIGCQRAPPSIMGWLWTMNGVKHLYTNLTKKHKNIRSISTRALQQDPLENLFGAIRSNCGSNVNPTVRQFVAALKSTIFSKLNSSTKGNCEEDNNKAIVENFKKLLNRSRICTVSTLPESSLSDDSAIEDFMSSITESFDGSVGEPSAEMQACAYVCGYI